MPTTLISGGSGAANSSGAPSDTWQVLTANAAANATTTLQTVMTTTGLAPGTYEYEYAIVYQSSLVGTGVRFVVAYGGTVTRTRMTRHGQSSTTNATIGDMDQTVTAVTGGVNTAWAGRTDAANLGPSQAALDANLDQQYERIRGVLVVSTGADLLLQHASETANSTQVMADTCLFLRKLAPRAAVAPVRIPLITSQAVNRAAYF